MSVSPFVYVGKPIESNKYEEESDYSEIEEKSHIKISKIDKSLSVTKKESNKSRINKSSVFKWNTSSLNAAKNIRMVHDFFSRKGKTEKGY